MQGTRRRVCRWIGGLLALALMGGTAGCAGTQATGAADAPTEQAAPAQKAKARANPMLPPDAREVNVARKLEQRQIAIIEQFLIGEPGVWVEGRNVRIRGAQRGPLWVIDGNYLSSPAGLNPRDVARMWISKSGSGYGRRGSTGVVIIETRM